MVPTIPRPELKSATPWWLPYVGLAVIVGGWLVQYGMDKVKHEAMEATVRKLDHNMHITNVINYSTHPEWTASILEAETSK